MAVAVTGGLTHSLVALGIGILMLALPGVMVVPKRTYIHLTSDEVARIDTLVEEFMSGFVSIEEVEKELKRIIDADRQHS